MRYLFLLNFSYVLPRVCLGKLIVFSIITARERGVFRARLLSPSTAIPGRRTSAIAAACDANSDDALAFAAFQLAIASGVGFSFSAVRKRRSLFECFPYVCPEPVLAK
eukprot:COSAG06_NODE_9794_length_1814_cov_3.723615_1_plen_108_part_00